MKITIEEIGKEQEEEMILRCHELNTDMLHLLQSLKATKNGLVGIKGEEIHRLSMDDIFYFEVVDNRAFFYCRENVYESKLKLYEFEKLCKDSSFFRASKSMILNTDKIDFVAPSFSGRFEATLQNGEKVTVSRQYVSILKKKMGLQ
ncbi:MAG: LytTR family transcriptional regulator [Clostridiales bacterium]|nr:LytTR family transcriptional regulator [Clostridiales bacterium]